MATLDPLTPPEEGAERVESGPRSLDQWLRGRALAPETFLRLAPAVAAALTELHGRQIVHRGLTPRHVLVDRNARVTLVVSPPDVPGPLNYAYLAPEQTGRTGRVVDERADLYALGAIYYEMLTGTPPFSGAASLDLMHAHLARLPTPPERRNPDVPEGLSAIVMRLLAKAPEARYQSARALLADLQRAEQLWQRQGTVGRFPLGSADLDRALPFPERLYGREAAWRELLAAWGRARDGAAEVVVLTGAAGLGKTTLARQLEDSARASGAEVIPVLFHVLQGTPLLDRLRQAVPGLAEALAEPANGASFDENPRRFEPALKAALGAWLERQPVLLFMDDLRWVDKDSLYLVDLLLGQGRQRLLPLLILGAVREPPASDAPLAGWLTALEARAIPVKRVALDALGTEDVSAFLVDALGAEAERVQPLAALLQRRTGGNPLWLRQLLRSLQQQSLLVRAEAGAWRWDLPRIERLAASDDVADLMIAGVQGLPEPCRQLLALAACFGPQTPLDSLAVVSDRDRGGLLAALAPALDAGLVMITSDGPRLEGARPRDSLQFAHDWLAGAAYGLLPEDQQRANHLRIGRLLLAEAHQDHTVVTAAAEQLNRARSLLRDDAERVQLAHLNLLAARLARPIAKERALELLQNGLAVLPEGPGPEGEAPSRVTVGSALHRDAVAVSSSLGTEQPGAHLFDQALKQIRSPVEGAELYQLRATACIARLDYPAGVELARHGLRLLGIDPIRTVSPEALDEELRAQELKLAARGKSEILTMPLMTDPRAIAAMRLLRVLKVAVYVIKPEWFPQVTLETLRVTLEHGRARETADALQSYGLLVLRRLGDLRRGHELGLMSLELANRSGDPATISQAVGIFTAALIHWAEPMRNALPLLERTVGPGLAAGEYLFALSGLVTQVAILFHGGAELDRVEEEIRRVSPTVGMVVRTEGETLLAYGRVIARLRGVVRERGCIEPEVDAREPGGRRQVMGPCRHGMLHLMVSYLLGEYQEAREHSAAAQNMLRTMGRTLGLVEHNVYTSLTLAALYEQTPRIERAGMIETIRGYQRQLDLWAEHCPENFRHKQLLVQAELGRIEGQDLEAAELYERAIAGAAAERFLHDEALANELGGRFHRARGRRGFGQLYLQRAVELYRRWGAWAKVQRLEQEFPDLPPAPAGIAQPGSTGAEGLDVAALLRAVETLSREVDEDRLLGRLMEVSLVAAGASRAALLLEEQGRLILRASGLVGQQPVLVRQEAEVVGAGPLDLVEQVRRSGEVLVRSHAVVLPILRQDRFLAALYLENQLLSETFSSDRIRFMHLLSGQIAASLENARLFREAREAVRLRDEFLAVASHELNTPLAALRLTVQGLEEGSLGETPEERSRRMKLMSRQVRRLNLLVDDLLDVAQIRTGQLRMRPELVDLALLARETAERFAEQAERSATVIRVNAESPVIGLWDRARLEQVISNLVANALKFAPGHPIQISVFMGTPGATLVVEDHGPGIDPQRLPHIFERFERGVPVTSHGGLGLGLYIVREIVQAFGGQITVASEPGRGARFTVVLPSSASAPPPEAH